MSRSSIRPYVAFGTGLLSVVAVLVAVAVPVVSRSDWWNTDTRTAATRPAALPQAALPDAPHRLWSATGVTSAADPSLGSAVVVAAPHRLAGRAVATGAELWHYERRNATLCGWTLQDGVVIAAFRHGGGCTDVVGLDAGTGQRRWYRNVELDSDLAVSAAPGVVVFGGSTSLTALATDSGLDRWKYSKAGCAFGPPTAGPVGVAVVLSCEGQGPLLSLHDPYKKDERWSVPLGGEQPRVLAVSDRVAVYATYQGQAAVSVYNERGTFTGSVADSRLAGSGPVAPRLVGGSVLAVWTGRDLVTVDLAAPRVLWTARASGPAAADAGAMWYPDGGDLVERALTGVGETRRVAVRGGPVDGADQLTRLGGLLVAGGRQGTAVYG